MSNLKIKICGMREGQNLQEVVDLQPDYLGFIFFPKSPRYVGDTWDSAIIDQVPSSIQRVGVFVNESMEFIIGICQKYHINTVQLHGNEDPLMCEQLQTQGYTVFKAFQVDDDTQKEEITPYQGRCSFFLYDTKSKGLGGSGKKFNWKKLNELNEVGPFLLSGGITSEDAKDILTLELSNLKGVDINSKFEIEPALKNIDLLKPFINDIRK